MKIDSTTIRQCPGCKAVYPRNDDPIALHPYGVVSPECWEAFTGMLAYEAEHLGYPPEHRLIVDAYGVQHPQNFELKKERGIEERLVRASVQSIGRHLIGLYCALEKKMDLLSISKVMGHVITHGEPLELLNPPADLGKITVADFSPGFTPEQYKEFAWKWAPYHDTVRGWVKKYAPHVK